MGIQVIIAGFLFAGAVFYTGWKIYINFFKQTPKTGCDKCDITAQTAPDLKIRNK